MNNWCVCQNCEYHIPPEDAFMCENPQSEYYGCFRNDYKTCDKWSGYIKPEEDGE